jgi:hypothetical protein
VNKRQINGMLHDLFRGKNNSIIGSWLVLKQIEFVENSEAKMLFSRYGLDFKTENNPSGCFNTRDLSIHVQLIVLYFKKAKGFFAQSGG